jgi:cell division protein FtsQ
MQQVKRGPRADPAPSRWSWRMQRLMLTPGFLLMLRAGLPFALTLAAATWWLSDPDNQTAIRDTVADARAAIEQRPEFMVNLMAIDGGDAELAERVRTAVPLDFPISSFDLDPDAIRARILEMPPIKQASVRIRPGGVLQIDLTPRVPVAVWRRPEGLSVIDDTGTQVATIDRRAMFPELPVIAGEKANAHVVEALDLIAAGAPLGDRLRGLVRLGERRWDVVLDRNQRILLPATGAVQALERVIALDGVEELLERDIARIDLRIAGRPTVRMNATATEEWWRIRQLNTGIE